MRSLTTLAAAAGILMAGNVMLPAMATTDTDAPASLEWKDCESRWYKGLLCAQFEVPLDHSNPEGEKISLRAFKNPATGEGGAQGTMFTSGWGPASYGGWALKNSLEELGEDITSTHDFVAIDARGNRGAALRCEKDVKDWPVNYEKEFPNSAADIKVHFQVDDLMIGACKDTMPAIINHMTTADSAKDIELFRHAVGADKFNIYTKGFAGVLASQYAQLFPSSVGKVVLNGTVDPVAYSTGRGADGNMFPVSVRTGGGAAAHTAVMAAMQECVNAGVDKCAQANTIMDDFATAEAGLRAKPLPKALIERSRYDYTVDLMADQLTRGVESPEDVAETFEKVNTIANLIRERSECESTEGADCSKFDYDGTIKYEDVLFRTRISDTGVKCSDTFNPQSRFTWEHLDGFVKDKHGMFGQNALWESTTCAGWPGKGDAYMGKYDTKLPHGMMIVHNEFDPYSPLSGAEAFAGTVPGAKLVTVKHGFGEEAVQDSSCAADHVRSYFLTGELPTEAQTCAQDEKLFN